MNRSLLSLLLVLLSISTVTAQSADTPDPRTVTVSGVGTIDVEPDEATVQFAVVTRAETAEDARRENAEAAEAAMDAVRSMGVADRNMQLLSLRLDEDVEFRNGQRFRKGFIARRDVKVTIGDPGSSPGQALDLVPRVVAEVVQRGANELNGIQYGLQDRESVEDQALRDAVARARQKAQNMAEVLGARLGRVVRIAEGNVSVPTPRPGVFARAEMAMDTADEGNPGAFAAGEITVRATVTVTFELE
ncbi:MAG: SIMPL domain-containing protein [Bacteroidota bacterium]